MKANTETKAHIESKLQNGHNLKSIYNYLLANLDEFGCANINYSEHGFKLSYTSNDNFQQGAKNGGGRGMYAHLKRCGFYQTVKIDLLLVHSREVLESPHHQIWEELSQPGKSEIILELQLLLKMV